MTLSSVATRYAHALADVVTESGSPLNAADALEQLRSFQATLDSSAALGNALTTPAVATSRKRAVIIRIGQELKLARVIRNFLCVLVDHRRITLLSQVIRTFDLAIDERLGFARAEITTPHKLSEDREAEVRVRLEMVSKKRLRARYTVDDKLIGGVVARIGSTVYDGSVRHQLNILRDRMRTES
jgi:F-type H+-transporting ATPase subunit delta